MKKDQQENIQIEGFDVEHFDRKKARQQKRKLDRNNGVSGKRFHRVGSERKWKWDHNSLYDED